ncbi:Asp-tRNA(Asn)/Glu-tRNA(Gln) amidotransferase subunit GatB [Mycoplasma marinum]|uniref:Aspartyl/glutamyl-tRNA(Asn/Gln) amidotransferase subunit B n=1 Tax=Mycoplasma marinum TaxID=1937190 RepID=A0A4R0XJG7_9MOLU|nr:Asp-tRNA(Asn)/Glu-tRNA(Gln) amidotransferase subunit GatB [Mycoplasma marinum]TCG10763.1 Asp-tRNA(Asn)/Glu-tRNA(Gln) amidotransferase GatCAB subunit B [Mycoplasma marinum]
MNNFEVVIGIEIHLELNTKTKMFSASKNDFNAEPNTNVSAIDLAYPGTMPVVNKQAVISGIMLGKALNMEIDRELHFDRKNYFYPDLPKGFQITQQRRPIGSNGKVPITVDGITKEITLERIHLEEDTAKQNHIGNTSHLNYNRAGVPLIEIVTNPVIRSGKEAAAYIDTIRKIAKTLNISDAKMEEGSLRADVNISLRPYGQKEFGTKVEIKNMNSISNAQKAIEFEIKLQTQKLLTNQIITMDTKRFDAENSSTITMRTKTNATDYKFFPEPNIPIIKLPEEMIESVKLPELPWEKAARLSASGLSEEYVNALIADVEMANYFDSINYEDKEKLAKVFFSEIVKLSNSKSLSVPELKIDQEQIAYAIKLTDSGDISGKHLKTLIPLLMNGEMNVDQIIEEKSMKQISDNSILLPIIDKIINENEKLVAEYDSRPERVTKFILGTLMKQTRGQANPIVSNKLVIKKLEAK